MPLLEPIPSPVVHADLAALEWQPLLSLVAGFAASPVGREAFLRCAPQPMRSGLRASTCLPLKCGCSSKSRFRFLWAASSIRRSWPQRHRLPVRRLKRRSCRVSLDSPTMSHRGRRSCASRRCGWPASCRDCRVSAALTASLRPLAESIERKIQPDGSLADDASPELNRIRREQERQQRVIEESLRAALRKLSAENATQDDVITIRGERFVIPVRAELKRRVTGVIHGASSSGQTVYVEPLETIEQNNELVRLIEEEQAEIHRIFVALTRQVAGYARQSGRRRACAGLGRQPFGEGALCARFRPLRGSDFWTRPFGDSGRPPSAARKAPAGEWREIGPAQSGADGRRTPVDHQRPEYRRQNGSVEDDGTPGDDGAGGNPGSGRKREFPSVHGVPGRHRRRAVDRGSALHFLRAHHQSRPALAAR